MIKKIRFLSISLCGVLSVLSLSGNNNPMILLTYSVFVILWIFISPKFPFIHLIMLPIFISSILIGFLYGNSLITQIILFVLTLTSWEIDSLYIDSKGNIAKENQWVLLKPLIIRELVSTVVIVVSWGFSLLINFPIGFWPLLLLVLLLIITMRKIFQL